MSLTTSPERIQHVGRVIDSLDLSHVTKVLLVLPETFGRTGERYQIPAELERHPKVEILRIGKDLGPISKMIPAVEHATRIDPQSLVITVDDDAVYPPGMIPEIIYHMARTRKTVFGGSVPSLAFFQVPLTEWRIRGDLGAPLAEGSGGVGYRAGEIDTKLLRRLSQLSPATIASDDLVINYALGRSGIRRRAISNRFFHRDLIQFLPHGFGADALHRGAGFRQEDVPDVNVLKYREALAELNRAMRSDRRGAIRAGLGSAAASMWAHGRDKRGAHPVRIRSKAKHEANRRAQRRPRRSAGGRR